MQMRVERLRETLKLLQPIVPKKTTLPVLKNVLLQDGKAIATDIDIAVALDLPGVEGKCLIPHHQVLEMLKYVPGNEMVTIECAKETGLVLSWDGGKASYGAEDPMTFPAWPEVKEAKATGEVDGDRLIPVLKSAMQYCATEEARPVLTGVSLSFGETIEVAAGDGFRMAYYILPLPFPAQQKVIVTASFVEALADLWAKLPPAPPMADTLVGQLVSKRMINLTMDENKLVASFGTVTIATKLIVGSAPDFSKLIPAEPALKVRVFAPDMERAVHRVKQIAREASGIVRFTWDDVSMMIAAESKDGGSIEAQIPVQAEGGPGRVAVNVAYLLNYLKGKEGLISMSVNDRSSPVLFRNGPSTPLVVIMPMFAEWPDEKKAKAEAKEAPAESSEEGPEDEETGEPPENQECGEPPEAEKPEKPPKRSRGNKSHK